MNMKLIVAAGRWMRHANTKGADYRPNMLDLEAHLAYTFRRIRDRRAVLATTRREIDAVINTSVNSIASVIEQHGWTGLFSTIQTADTHPSKPHPSMLEAAIAETGADKSRCFFVGDTSYDMSMAVSAGISGIGVDWGYHPVASLREAGASRIISAMQDLLDLQV